MTRIRMVTVIATAAVVATLATGCQHRYGPGAGSGQGPSGWGMGPGMMGGYGPGMMAGHGPGGLWGLERLDLSADQRAQIARIQDEFAAQHDAMMRSMHERGGMHGRMFDNAADRRSYEEMAALHKQMFEMHLQSRQRILDVLTPAQREQLGRGRPGR